MAQIRQFQCPHCQYHVEASGGEDRGLEIYTQTLVCHDCREIQDVVVRKFELPGDPKKMFPDPQARPLVSAWTKFKVGEIQRKSSTKLAASQYEHLQHYWKKVPLRCRNSSFHSVDTWFGMNLPLSDEVTDSAVHQEVKTKGRTQGGCCPKCGKQMRRSQPLASWE